METYALITGASSGIGLELARTFAKNGHNLILIARSYDKLVELKSELQKNYPVDVVIFSADLADIQQCEKIFKDTKESGLEVEYLINNAGFGHHGYFHKTSAEKNLSMIRLNVEALTYLTQLFLPEMLKRKSGYIMNVASTAGFIPGPYMATYFATKNYVVALSLALAVELKPFGIHVIALCPGPTQSNFAQVAEIKGDGVFKKNIPSSQEVAEFAYKKMMKKRTLAIHGFQNRFTIWLSRWMPRKLLAIMVGKVQKMKV